MPKLTLSAVNKRIAELQKVADKLKRTDKAPAIKAILNLMSKHDVSLNELRAAEKGAKEVRRGRKGRPTTEGKYRNSETGETWAGRGRKPNWVVAAEKAGKSLSSFVASKAG